MNAMLDLSGLIDYPVAIRDKDLRGISTLRVQIYEMCTVCGERFGIGYLCPAGHVPHGITEAEELPMKLQEILAKDHRQERQHKNVIELDN